MTECQVMWTAAHDNNICKTVCMHAKFAWDSAKWQGVLTSGVAFMRGSTVWP